MLMRNNSDCPPVHVSGHKVFVLPVESHSPPLDDPAGLGKWATWGCCWPVVHYENSLTVCVKGKSVWEDLDTSSFGTARLTRDTPLLVNTFHPHIFCTNINQTQPLATPQFFRVITPNKLHKTAHRTRACVSYKLLCCTNSNNQDCSTESRDRDIHVHSSSCFCSSLQTVASLSRGVQPVRCSTTSGMQLGL